MELVILSTGILVIAAALVWRLKNRQNNRKNEVPDPEREMAIRDSLRKQYSENPRGRENINVNQNQYLGPGI